MCHIVDTVQISPASFIIHVLAFTPHNLQWVLLKKQCARFTVRKEHVRQVKKSIKILQQVEASTFEIYPHS